jgi:endonuclease/exonuclease/phosphatase family metal-dependent hydrolase
MRNRVRVATYNLYLGADLSLLLGSQPPEVLAARRAEVERQLLTTAFPARARNLARVLVNARADLVGLQEVCVWHADGRPLWDFAATLVTALRELGEEFEVVAGQPTFEGAGQVPSAHGLVDVWLQGSNTMLRRTASAVQVESVSVGLFESALTTPALGQVQVTITRGWCSADCTVDGDPATGFTFVNTHTEAYDEPARNRQRDELLAVLPGPERRLVLVGDFNSVPEDVGMPSGFRDAWVAAGQPSSGPAAWTCCQGPDLGNPEPAMSERIDYVWVRGIDVVAAERHGADPADRDARGLWPSDHACVVAELQL